MLFSHCPRCGSPRFSANDARSKRCADCGFVFYLNSAAAVAALITDDMGRLLVATRACDPARGALDLPGGFVEPGESLEEGLRREVAEETSCHIKNARYLFSLPNSYLFSGFEVPTTDSFFLCTLEEGSRARAHDDVAALQWIEIGNMRPELFGLTSIRRGMAMFLANMKNHPEQH